MTMRPISLALVLALSLSAPVFAHERAAPLPEDLFGGIVHERDVSLLFDYLRDAARAAIEGREAPPPDVLTHRAEEITGEVKRRSGIAARMFIDLIERSVREGMREQPRQPQLPPAYPRQRI